MGAAEDKLTEHAGDDAAALELFRPFEHFSKCLLDAYAVIDADGRVQKCSALLSTLVGMRTKQILKADSLDAVLSLSVAGKPLTIAQLLAYPGPTRIDEVSGDGAERKGLNLIIGVYPLQTTGGVVEGAFILLRDVTAETSLQDKYKDKAAQSITDALTGLFNRAYFSEHLRSQVATLEGFPEAAPQRVLSVVMMDIDFFKKINDVYGHQAGDHVLRHTADLLKKSFRKTDIVARYGGEEFLAILPGTDVDGAAVASDKMRQAVQNFRFDFQGTVIPVTISSGVAQIDVGRENGEQAIARADAALYHSKESGRNRVSIHDGHAVRVYDATVKTDED